MNNINNQQSNRQRYIEQINTLLGIINDLTFVQANEHQIQILALIQEHLYRASSSALKYDDQDWFKISQAVNDFANHSLAKNHFIYKELMALTSPNNNPVKTKTLTI